MPLVLNGTTGVQDNSGAFVAGTSVSASSTAVDFTSIPSWVKRVTVMFNGISTNGSSNFMVQIGSGSVDSSGYASTSATVGSASVFGVTNGSTGWAIITGGASSTLSGTATISLIGSNTWVFDATTSLITSTNTNITAGHKTALSGALDRVRITTVNGTDTFDAGTINILYE